MQSNRPHRFFNRVGAETVDHKINIRAARCGAHGFTLLGLGVAINHDIDL